MVPIGHHANAIAVARAFAVADLVEAIRANVLNQIASRFRRSDVVVIEDIGDLRHRPAAQGELGTLIAGWVAAGARVVCTAGCSLQALTEFERPLPPAPASRVVALPKPTRREMRAALRTLATTASISLDGQSLRDLTAWCNGDIRRAVGAIRQIRFEGVRKRPIRRSAAMSRR